MSCLCKEKKIKKLPHNKLSTVKVSIYPGCCKQYEEEFHALIEALNLLPCEYKIFDELPCCSHNIFPDIKPHLALNINLNTLKSLSEYSNIALTACSSCFLCFKKTLKLSFKKENKIFLNRYFRIYNSFSFLLKYFFRYIYTMLSFYKNQKILFLVSIHNILGEDKRDIFVNYLKELKEFNVDIFELKYLTFDTLEKYFLYKEPFEFYIDTLKKVKSNYDFAISFSSLNTYYLKLKFGDFIKDIWKEISLLKLKLG